MNIFLGLVGESNGIKDYACDILEANFDFIKVKRFDYFMYKLVDSCDFSSEDIFDNWESFLRCAKGVNSFILDVHPTYIAELLKNKVKELHSRALDTNHPYRIVIPDIYNKEEMSYLLKNKSTFIVNKSITEAGVIVGDLFDFRLSMKVTGDIDYELAKEIPQAKDLENDFNLFADSGGSREDFKRSLFLVMSGLIKEGYKNVRNR